MANINNGKQFEWESHVGGACKGTCTRDLGRNIDAGHNMWWNKATVATRVVGVWLGFVHNLWWCKDNAMIVEKRVESPRESNCMLDWSILADKKL